MSYSLESADESRVHMLYGLVAQEVERARIAGDEPDFSELLNRYPDQVEEIQRLVPTIETLCHLGEEGDVNADDGAVRESIMPLKDLGDFRLVREIGRGGMGVVYEAFQLSLGRRVAVKVLPLASLLDKRQLERFKNEARAAAMLKHPHIVSVYSVGCERSVHFYAMELIEGQSLAHVIEQIRSNLQEDQTKRSPRHKPSDADRQIDEIEGSKSASISGAETSPVAALSTERQQSGGEFYRAVARLGSQAAEALHDAHTNGVIHRDIKPSNLLLDQEGQLHVADFGLARIQTGEDLTMTGDVVGTLRYMSPEQLNGHVVDERTDVYSLGVTLYELATGVPAFDGDNRQVLTQQVLESSPLRPAKISPGLPRDLETVILKSIDKDPVSRYPSAEAMLEDLRRFLANRPVAARRVSKLEHARRWAARNRVIASLISAVAILLLAIATGSSTVAWRSIKESRMQEIGLYSRDMRLAQQAIDGGRFLEAERTLLNWVPTDEGDDHRGFEWYHLWLASHDPAIEWTISHPLPVFSVAFLGEDDRLAVGWFNRRVPLWGLGREASDAPVQRIRLKQVSAHRIARLTPNDSLFIGENGGSILEVNVPNGEEVARYKLELPSSIDTVTGIDVDSDERYLACAAGLQRGSVVVWDRDDGSVAFSRTDMPGRCQATFAADGSLIVAASKPARLEIHNIEEGKCERTATLDADHCYTLDVSPDRTRLAISVYEDRGEERNSRIELWDIGQWSRIWTLNVPGLYVRALEFSPDGKRLIAGTFDGTIRLIDASNGVVRRVKRAHSGEVSSLAFSSNGQRFASSGTEGNVLVWNASAFEESNHERMKWKNPAYLAGASLLDNKTAVFADKTGTVRRWDLDQNDVRTYFHVDYHLEGDAVHLATSSDGRRIVVTRGHWPRQDLPAKVEVVDAESGETHSEYELPNGTIYSISSFSPDNQFLAVCSGHEAVIFDVNAKEMVRELECGNLVKATAFSPDGKWFACASTDGITQLYEVPTFSGCRKYQTDARLCEFVDFSPDSRYFVAVGMDQRVRIFETLTGRPVNSDRFKQLSDFLVFARFSADGKRIVSGGLDGKVRIWHVESGEELLSFDVDRASFSMGQFSADGNTVVVGCADEVFAFRTANANTLGRLSLSELTDVACQNLIEFSYGK